MTRRLLRDAAILAGPGEPRLIRRGWLLMDGGVIAALGEGDPPEDALAGAELLDGRRRLAVPGLVNAHTHSQSATLAGFGDRLSHPAFMWRTLARTANRSPRETALAVQLTAWWALTTGTTALLDHFPGQRFTTEDVEAVLSAWHATGLRAVVGLRFFDQGFADILPDGMSPDADQGLLRPQPLDSLAEIASAAIARWHRRDGRIGVFPAPSNPDRCSDAALRVCADLALRHDTGLHAHLLETSTQARQARALRHGQPGADGVPWHPLRPLVLRALRPPVGDGDRADGAPPRDRRAQPGEQRAPRRRNRAHPRAARRRRAAGAGDRRPWLQRQPLDA